MSDFPERRRGGGVCGQARAGGFQRILTADEVESVLAVFSSVELTGPDLLCAGVASDPCLVRVFSWDSFDATDLSCVETRVLSEPILELLEQLRAGSEDDGDEGKGDGDGADADADGVGADVESEP